MSASVQASNDDLTKASAQLDVDSDLSVTFSDLGMSMAHFAAERYEEAAVWAKRSIRNKTVEPAAYRYLAASCAHLDRVDEARSMRRDRQQRGGLPFDCALGDLQCTLHEETFLAVSRHFVRDLQHRFRPRPHQDHDETSSS